MNFLMQPWHLLILALASWLNREQQQVIECLKAEDHVLRERLGTKHIQLTDDQRGCLAVTGKVLGRKLLSDIGTSSASLADGVERFCNRLQNGGGSIGVWRRCSLWAV